MFINVRFSDVQKDEAKIVQTPKAFLMVWIRKLKKPIDKDVSLSLTFTETDSSHTVCDIQNDDDDDQENGENKFNKKLPTNPKWGKEEKMRYTTSLGWILKSLPLWTYKLINF